MGEFPVTARASIVVAIFLLTLFAPLAYAAAAGGAEAAGEGDQVPAWPDYMRYININGFAFDPLGERPDIPGNLRYSDASTISPYYIVQFDQPVTDEMKASLGPQGVSIIGYVSYNGFVVRVEPSKVDDIERLPHVRWTGVFEPAYKLSPRLSDEFEEMLVEAEERARDETLAETPVLSFDPDSPKKAVALDASDSASNAFSMSLEPEEVEGALGANEFLRGTGGPDGSGIRVGGTSITITAVTFERTEVTKAADAISRLGGTDITYSYAETGMVRASIGKTALALLAREPEIMWIDRFVQPAIQNDISRWVLQSADGTSHATPLHDHGLWGTGQTVTVGDSGVDYEHDAFEDPAHPVPGLEHRKITNYYVPMGALGDLSDNGINHGTHVSCTVAGDDGVWHVYDGDDIASNCTDGPHDGQAFDAKLHVQDLSTDGYWVFPPTDLHGLFQPAMERDSWIHTNSWGSVFGDYTEGAQQIDDFLWDNKEFLVVFSAGNSGAFPEVVSPYAAAKNSIGVGASLNGPLMGDVASFSSRGPAADGRIKPDVMAPGYEIWSARGGDPWGEYDDYVTLSGTSMAAPNVAGSLALIRQYYMDGFYPTGAKMPANGFTPSAALVKATLINGAVEMTGAGAYANDEFFYPNNNQGWGRVLLDNALHLEGDSRGLVVDDNREGLSTGGSRAYQFNVGDSSEPIEVTLVWTDYPGAEYSTPSLVNNLDLRVTAPDGTLYIGNAYGGMAPAESVPDPEEESDHINNVEGVLILTGVQVGVWTIEVVGYNVPMGPQPYAVVMVGGTAAKKGGIVLDRENYRSDATVGVTVLDADLNIDPESADTALAEMTSTTEATTSQAVVLTETGPATSVFMGAVLLENSASPVEDDGKLQVQNGDLITAAYYDDDDGLGGSGWVYHDARVDDDPPAISEVAVKDVRFNRATIAWQTDEPSDSTLTYGDSSPPSLQIYDPRPVTYHEVRMSGLVDSTTYCFSVGSADDAGNAALDDNSGLYHEFTTSDWPATIAPNDDWPMLQNNLPRQGLSLAEFSPPLTFIWSDGPHTMQRWNSPVVADGVLISATLDGYIRARDPYEGTVLWERKLGGTSYYTCTPAADDGVVYAAFYGPAGGQLYALDLISGNTIWSTGPDSGLDVNARIALACADGLVFGATWDDQVFALDAADGSVEWCSEVWGTPYGGPAVDSGLLFTATTSGTLSALDELSGDAVWTRPLNGTATSVPLVAHGNVYVGTYDGVMHAFEEFTGSVEWTVGNLGGIDACTPAYDGSSIYFGSWDSKFYALDASNGNILWATPCTDPVSSSMAYADGYLYGTCWSGVLYELDASDGSPEHTVSLGDNSYSSLAIYDGWVFTEDAYGNMYGLHGLTPVSLCVSPSRQSKMAAPLAEVYYRVNVTNLGSLGSDTFDVVAVQGDLGWEVELLEADGVTPLQDNDMDGVEDTGPLSYGAKKAVIARITVPELAGPGDAEETVLMFTSSTDDSVHKNASVKTVIPMPGLTFSPPVHYSSVMPDDLEVVTITVTNTGAFADTFDLLQASEHGWTAQLLELDGTTPLEDTDSDGVPDTGLMAGFSSRGIKVAVHVPEGVVPDDFDRLTVAGSSSLDPLASSRVTIFLECALPPSNEWPTAHNDVMRRGTSGDVFSPPLEQVWASGTNEGSMMSGPVMSNGILLTTTLDGYIRARNAYDGALLWERRLGGQNYYTCSPAVADGVVYVPFTSDLGSTLHALDEVTGETIWSLGTSSGISYNARAPLACQDGMVYGLGWDGEVFALDASNGSLVWEYGTDDLPWGGVALARGALFTGTRGGTVLAFDQTTGDLLWSRDIYDSSASAPVVAQGCVFVTTDDGSVRCLDMTDGSPVWTRDGMDFFYLSTPAYADGTLYVGDTYYTFYAINATDGTLRWDTFVGDGVVCSPAYANGFVYATSLDGTLYSFDAATGAIVDSESLCGMSGLTTSSPAVSDGWIWVEDYYGEVHAFIGRVPVGVMLNPTFMTKDASPDTALDYEFRVTNLGQLGPDTFEADLTLGTYGWAVELFDGDGVTPLDDTDHDGKLDTGEMDTNEGRVIIARMTVPPTASPEDQETASVRFTSDRDPEVCGSVRIRATVPPPGVAIGPEAVIYVVANETARANLVVDNLGGLSDTMDISYCSNLGWPVALFASDGVTPLEDTDSDLVPDTGPVGGLDHVTLVAEVMVPADAVDGMADRLTLRADSSADAGVSDSVTLIFELGTGPDDDWPTYQNNMARGGSSPGLAIPPLERSWTVGSSYAMVHSGPAYSDGLVFVNSRLGLAAAFNAFTGLLVWQRYLGTWELAGTPTVVGDVVYLNVQGATGVVYALNRTTGSTIWSAAPPGLDVNARMNLAEHEGAIFGASWNGHVFALYATNGTLRWDLPLNDSFGTGLAWAAGRVLIGSLSGKMYSIHELNGSVAWTTQLDGAIRSTPLCAQGMVLIGTANGSMYSLDSATGAVLWKTGGLGSFHYSGPAFDGTRLFVGTGTGACYALDPVNGGILWFTMIGSGSIESGIACAGGYVYTTTSGGYLCALDADDGLVCFKYMMTTLGSTSSIAISESWLWTGASDGRVFAFKGAEVVGLEVAPASQRRDVIPGAEASYSVNITNTGVIGPDTFDATVMLGTSGWAAGLFGSDGVTPLEDTDSDGLPDTGPIPMGSSAEIVVKVDVPASAVSGDRESTTITFTSSIDVSKSGSAVVTGEVPQPGVEIGPSTSLAMSPGDAALTPITVRNTGPFSDTFDIDASSRSGWDVQLLSGDGMTPLQDTDGDGLPDTGVLEGLSSTGISVLITVPGDAPETYSDMTAVTATSSANASLTDTCAIACELGSVASEDWPTFHQGAGRAGVSPIPYELPLTQVWTYPLGVGVLPNWYGPVISNYTVYCTDSDGRIIALDVRTGALKWMGALGEPGLLSSSPTVAYGNLYAAFAVDGGSAQELFALDPETGAERWSYTAGKSGSPDTTIAFGAGLVFWHDSSGGRVLANDAFTGDLAWQYTFPDGGWGNTGPTYWGGMVIANDDAGNVVALDAITGEQLWLSRISHCFFNAVAVDGGVAYAVDEDAVAYALDAFTGELLWEKDGLGTSSSYSAPTVHDDRVFIGANNEWDGVLSALDADTGGLIWNRTIVAGPIYSAPAYSNGVVYVVTDNGQLHAIDAETGTILQSWSTTGQDKTSIAIGDGHLLFGDTACNWYGWRFEGVGAPASLEIRPGLASVAVEGSAQFEAIAYDDLGREIPGLEYNWSALGGLGTVTSYGTGNMSASYTAGTQTGEDILRVEISGLTAEATISVTPGPASVIMVAPSDCEVPAGGTVQFSAQLFDEFGNEIPDATVAWSADASIGSISQDGLLTASTVSGTGTVTATFGEVNGSAAVTVVPGELDHLEASPDTIVLAVTEQQTVTVRAYDAYGNEISGISYAWVSDMGTATPLEGTPHIALFTAGTTAGSGTLIVSYGAVSITLDITVLPGALASISVSPSDASIPAGSTLAFLACGYDSYDNEIPGLEFHWTADASIGSISQDGVLTAATTTGTGTLTATLGMVKGEASVTVVPAALDHLVTAPESIVVTAGEYQSVVVLAYDGYGNEIQGLTFTWSSTIGSVAPAGGTTCEAEFAAGTVAGTGTLTASNGTVSVQVEVTVLPGPLSAISVSPSEVSVAAGTSAAFQAVGYDAYGNEIAGLALVWSADPEAGTISQAGVLTASESVGSGTVLATAGSVHGSAQVTVVPGALAAISVTPASLTIEVDSTALVSASGTDMYGNLISGTSMTVVCVRGTVIVIQDDDTSAWYTAPTSVGTDTVTLSSGTISTTVQITVVPGDLDRLFALPVSINLKPGEQVVISVNGIDLFGNTVALEDVDWSCTVGSLTVSLDGMSATFLAGDEGATGRVVITADGKSVIVHVTIEEAPRTLADDLTSGPAVALMLLVAALVVLLVYLLLRRKDRGGQEPQEALPPGAAESETGKG